MDKVSVIVNCRNGGIFLHTSLKSIYNQSHDNFEIIFWDNLSTDNSLEIANSFDKRLKVFQSKSPLSLGEARNQAMKKATGDFICFLDTDDIFLKNRISSQINLMRQNSFNLAIGGYDEIDFNGEILSSHSPAIQSGNSFGKLLRHYNVNLQTILIKKSLIQRLNVNFDPNLELTEDYDFFMHLAHDSKILVIKDQIAQYRIHENQLTKKD